MWQRLLPFALCAACTWACGDDASSGGPGVSGPNYAGSCNHEAQALCDEYAIDNATAATPGECTSAGGAWATTQCPFDGRTGVCASAMPATRSYAYSDAAATSLMSSCPDGKFTKIAGATPTGGAGGAGGTVAPPVMMPDAGATDGALMAPDAMSPDGGV